MLIVQVCLGVVIAEVLLRRVRAARHWWHGRDRARRQLVTLLRQAGVPDPLRAIERMHRQHAELN